MNRYFVSFSYPNGTGCTVVEINKSIESIEDIEKIIDVLQNDECRNFVIMNIQKMPI